MYKTYKKREKFAMCQICDATLSTIVARFECTIQTFGCRVQNTVIAKQGENYWQLERILYKTHLCVYVHMDELYSLIVRKTK